MTGLTLTGIGMGSFALIGGAGFVWDRLRGRRHDPLRRGSDGARARYYRDTGDATFGHDQTGSGLNGGHGW